MTGAHTNAYLGTPDVLLSTLILLVGLFGGVLLLAALARVHRLPLAPTILVFVGYLFLGAVNYVVGVKIFMSPDAATYDVQALSVAGDMGLRVPMGLDIQLYSGKEGFPTILGFLYRIFGRVPVAGVVFNSFVSALTVMVIFAASRLAFGAIAQRFVLACFLLLPAFVTYGSDLLREALCWLSVALITYFVVAFAVKRNRLTGALGAAVGILLLLWVRSTLGLLSLVAIVVAIGLMLMWRGMGKRALFALLASMLGGVFLFGDWALQIIGYDSSRIALIRRFNRQDASSGYHALLESIENSGVGGAILATLPNSVFGPFPWEIGIEPVWAWVLINALFWWVALFAVARRIWVNGLNSVTVSLLVFAAVLLVGMSVTLTNYGLLLRIRTIPMIVLLVLMAQPIAKRHVARVSVPDGLVEYPRQQRLDPV